MTAIAGFRSHGIACIAIDVLLNRRAPFYAWYQLLLLRHAFARERPYWPSGVANGCGYYPHGPVPPPVIASKLWYTKLWYNWRCPCPSIGITKGGMSCKGRGEWVCLVRTTAKVVSR